MPYRTARGNYRIKRSFGFVGGVNVGHVNISLLTGDEADAHKIEQAILTLALPDVARGDLLVDLRDGKRTPQEIYEMTRRQRLKSIAHIHNGTTSLADAIEVWLPVAMKKSHMKISDRTRASYRAVANLLLKPEFAGHNPVVSDLPAIYKEFHKKYHAAQKYRTVNKAVMFCLAFARGTQPSGINSDLYRAIQSLPKAPNKPKRQRKGQTVYQVRRILEKIPSPQFQNIATFMAFTGCHGAEYRSGFEIKDDRILIHGTKTENRNRVVPRIWDFHRETLSAHYNYLNDLLKTASGDPTFTHYDLRASYQQWLKEAGIPDVRVKRYMGHITKTVSDGYDSEDTEQFEAHLRQDTAALIAYVEANWEPKKTTTVKQAPLRAKIKLTA